MSFGNREIRCAGGDLQFVTCRSQESRSGIRIYLGAARLAGAQHLEPGKRQRGDDDNGKKKNDLSSGWTLGHTDLLGENECVIL